MKKTLLALCLIAICLNASNEYGVGFNKRGVELEKIFPSYNGAVYIAYKQGYTVDEVPTDLTKIGVKKYYTSSEILSEYKDLYFNFTDVNFYLSFEYEIQRAIFGGYLPLHTLGFTFGAVQPIMTINEWSRPITINFVASTSIGYRLSTVKSYVGFNYGLVTYF